MTAGRYGDNELDGASSLEIALDRATERYLSSVQERRDTKRGHAPPPPTTALATLKDVKDLSAPLRLRWKGRAVAPELQEYAARVARGEQLAPYRGPILAQPCAEFPWGERRPTRTPVSQDLPFEQRSSLRGVWLFGAAGLLMAAVGISSGIGSSDEVADPFTPVQTQAALTPAPAAKPLAAAEPEPNVAPLPAPSPQQQRTTVRDATPRINPVVPLAPVVRAAPAASPSAPVETVSSSMGLPPLVAVTPSTNAANTLAPALSSADTREGDDLASNGSSGHKSSLFEAQPSF
jgi:hypothetical protein